MQQFAPVEGTYTLQVRAHTYRNSVYKDAAGYCCEIYRTYSCNPWWCGSCRCDNRFNFCVRNYGTRQDNNAGNCPLGSMRTGVVYNNNDYFNFPSRMGGVSNPMSFTGSSWPVSSTISTVTAPFLISKRTTRQEKYINRLTVQAEQLRGSVHNSVHASISDVVLHSPRVYKL